MGLFSQTSPFDADIEKATSEKKTTEDWSLIMDVCDKVTASPDNSKDCLKSIMRRMGHNDPHVVIQAITLLDACINNCGKEFHLEVASRDFETEYARLLSKAQPPVALKMKQVLKRWAETEFKTDPKLHLIVTFYQKLKSDGHDFSDIGPKTPKSSASAPASKDPNVVSSQQEEDDIAKAIELSLKDAKNSPKKQTIGTSGAYPSLYPSFTGSGSGSLGSITSGNSLSSQAEPRKVRALYDFEAAEENEITFVAGEIIHVLDDSDPSWWKGFNQRGEGLFPSNFVTADLSVEPESLEINQKTKKSVQFDDSSKKEDSNVESVSGEDKKEIDEINEGKIDRLLHLLHEANPEDPSQDSDEMLRLEEQVHNMGPLIDAELERVDRKHAQLTQLSSELVEAINMYHTSMREDRNGVGVGVSNPGQMPGFLPGFNPQQNLYYGQMQSNMFNSIGPNVMNQGHMQMAGMMQQQNMAQNSQQLTNVQRMPMASAHGERVVGGQNPNPIPFSPQSQQPQMISMHYQNGHQNSPIQQQIVNNLQGALASTQSQLQHTQPHPQNFSAQTPQQSYQIQLQHSMMSQQNMQHLPSQQQQGQFVQTMPTQQFSPRQVMLNNGQIMATGAPTMPSMVGMIPPGMHPNAIPNMHQLPGFSPQMAAINQPVTQTILGQQNDSKTNIPIFQQQR